MSYGYIYKITNLINGKIYVGKHKYPFNKMDNSYWGSGLHLKRALDTYGKHETHPCYGLHWWTNGVDKPIKSKECPGEGYRLGRK